MPGEGEDIKKTSIVLKIFRNVSLVIALFVTLFYAITYDTFSNVEETVVGWIPSLITLFIILFITSIIQGVSRPIIRGFLSNALKKGEYVEGPVRLWSYIIWFLALMIMILSMSGNIAAAGISLGIFGAGIAFAMQQPLTCLVGWIFVVMRRPYAIGDRIMIDNVRGDVIDLTMLYTILRELGGDVGIEEPTGSLVTLPNSTILQKPITNYTADNPYIFEEVENAVTYESDYRLAKNIMIDAAKEVIGEDMKKAYNRVLKEFKKIKLEQSVFEEPQIRVELGDFSVNMRVRFICEARKRRKVKSDITWNILEKFNAPENKGKVEIAYPHTELVFHKEVTDTPWKEFLEKR